MTAPQSRLSTELGHALGSSLLADAMMSWRPSSTTLQHNLVEETLSHARALCNVMTNILEQRAVVCDEGGGPDLCDNWDLFGLSDLLGSLLEVITIVKRQETPESAGEPEPELITETESLWLADGNGGGHWVDAQVKVPCAE